MHLLSLPSNREGKRATWKGRDRKTHLGENRMNMSEHTRGDQNRPPVSSISCKWMADAVYVEVRTHSCFADRGYARTLPLLQLQQQLLLH